ncbi:MAG: hypothetical protein M0Z39_06600 [Actinomycetota bacterium]|jgi:hypothetical protein|nr:hypothetical protein [Actinomycetota bacterium]
MRANAKLLAALGIAGLSLAACGSNNSALTDGGKIPIERVGAVASTTTSASPAYGFNASRTKFVLPHNLGLLPASELALAKNSPSYATGLANPNNWGHEASVGTLVAPWYYIGPAGAKAGIYAAEVANEKAYFYGTLKSFVGNENVLHTTNLSINVSTLNSVGGSVPAVSLSPGMMPAVLLPTSLEFAAAPVGVLNINGKQAMSICVPEPVAWILGGKVVNFPTRPVITAGPSTVFAITGFHSGDVHEYDKGMSSCASFS